MVQEGFGFKTLENYFPTIHAVDTLVWSTKQELAQLILGFLRLAHIDKT